MPDLLRLHKVPALSWDECRMLVESVEDYAIFMLDVDGVIATWNRGAEKIKGYSAAEAIGRHYSIFYTPEDLAAGKPERELATARAEGRVEDEGWRLRKDGTRFWANVVITALHDESGQLRGFGKVTRDLTGRKAAEDELRLSEQRFHTLVDGISDHAIFMLDPSGTVLTWSSGARKIKGYAADEIIGRDFSVFYTPEDRAQRVPQKVLQIAREQGRFEETGWRVRKDGTRFWARVAISPLRDAEGRLIGFAKVTRDLTEREQVREDLRRAEERFRLLVEGVTDYAICMLDPEGHVETWNVGAERITGYHSSEIVSRHFSVFFREVDVASRKPQRELEIAALEGRFEDEAWRVRKDGSRFWANVVLTALRDASGRLIGYAKVTRDLSSRLRAQQTERELLREQVARAEAEESERRLRESEDRYRALSRRLEVILEGVGDGVTVQDRDGRIVFANSAAARNAGYDTAADFMRVTESGLRQRFELFDERGKPFDADNLPGRRVLRGEASSSATLYVRDRETNRTWWSLVRASGVMGADGQAELAVIIWHDVTNERRQEAQEKYLAAATAALSSSLEYESMLGTLANLLVPDLADWCSIHLLEQNELKNVAVSHADPKKVELARAIQGRYPPLQDAARGVWQVIRSGNSELYADVSDELLVQGARDAEHLQILRDLGVCSLVIAPIRTHERVCGTITLVSSTTTRRFDRKDVALLEELGRRAGTAIEHAKLYEAAQHSARRAEEANRIKDEFLATVSHELRTPLNAIVGWAALLRERTREAATLKALEVIHRNALAQARIVEDILDVSRIIAGKLRLDLKPSDLSAIVLESLEVVRPSATAKSLKLEYLPPPADCVLVADPGRIQQVVWNLLSNAVKFTELGGTISVVLERQDSHLVLMVADTGRGIEPEFLPYVFDRFQQADSSFTRRVGGLGLGLAIVRHIVELHGGHVRAESAGLGQGARFVITLPLRTTASIVPEHVRQPSAERTTGTRPDPQALLGVRVLVVDDEQDARDLLLLVLGEAGATVQAAASAADGFERFQSFQPHVLVSDIGMPGEDGLSFMKRIRASHPANLQLPSIALTAYTRDEDKTKALAAGFTTHIAKPVDPDDLVTVVINLAALIRR